jgi:predicted nucleic acid-binding protein
MRVDRLIDTNFLISRWRDGEGGAAAAWLKTNGDLVLGIPWIVKAEFLRGAEIAGHDRQSIRDFLKRFPTVWPDEETLEIYASLYSALKKRNELIGPNDLWIGASALQKSVPLVSKNKAEFQRVPGLSLEGY